MERQIIETHRDRPLEVSEHVVSKLERRQIPDWEVAINELREMLAGGPSLEDEFFAMRRPVRTE